MLVGLVVGIFVAAGVFAIGSFILLFAERRRRAIRSMEDAEPFEDNDSRLANVPAPEESDHADSVR